MIEYFVVKRREQSENPAKKRENCTIRKEKLYGSSPRLSMQHRREREAAREAVREAVREAAREAVKDLHS